MGWASSRNLVQLHVIFHRDQADSVQGFVWEERGCLDRDSFQSGLRFDVSRLDSEVLAVINSYGCDPLGFLVLVHIQSTG